jgi:hypothetical protein
MSRYILIRRLRGPAFLLLVGVLALLAQAHILSWGKSWPLFLILWGVLSLAERAALAAEGDYPPGSYPGSCGGPNQGSYAGPYQGQYPGQYPGSPYSGAVDPAASQTQAPAQPGSAMVPTSVQTLVKSGEEPEGGKS